MANAPHIPVHLGAMQHAVQWQVLVAVIVLMYYKFIIPHNRYHT